MCVRGGGGVQKALTIYVREGTCQSKGSYFQSLSGAVVCFITKIWEGVHGCLDMVW